MLLKKHFLLLSMLKKVVRLNVYGNVILVIRKFIRKSFFYINLLYIINIFTATFDQLNASLLSKSVFFQKSFFENF